jgi:murein DD-endopeptidase MepM/ murein hydrolase activator NlpD
MIRYIFIIFLTSFSLSYNSFSQDTSNNFNFELYKKKENKSFENFKNEMLKELNNHIKHEQNWNTITIENIGNVEQNSMYINNTEITNKQKLINQKSHHDSKPDYVNIDSDSKIRQEIIHPLKTKTYNISSNFGYRIHPIHNTKRFHSGIDIAAPKNTLIHSIMAGKVLKAGYVNGYGNYIVVLHEKGIKSSYAHLNEISVEKGQKVYKGEIIGKVGKSGSANGYHLHFEIIHNNKKINPEPFL